MNRLSLQKRAQILQMLVEGNSMRSTSRMADVSINTVTKLLVDTGQACAEYQFNALRNLPCKNVQVDELWSFCRVKQKNVPKAKLCLEADGNVWTWIAICADTKLVPCWLVADREWRSGYRFLSDLKSRMANRIQLTSDGYKAYPMVMESLFGHNEMDFAMLVKQYDTAGRRYIGSERTAVMGNPNLPYISTSFVERQNLTLRMGCRRYTRKTNGFSKKIENHAYAVSLHFMYYNFGRIHKTLRVTPAMAAGVSKHMWTMEEMADLAK